MGDNDRKSRWKGEISKINSVDKVEKAAEDVTHGDKMVVKVSKSLKMVFTRRILTSSAFEGRCLRRTI